MAFNPKDHYFHKAKSENFAARSVYKLEEINKKHRVLKSGDQVLDLGSSPGSWSQYASKVVGPKGHVIAMDLKPMTVSLPNVECVQANALEVDWPTFFKERGIERLNVVLSDMAPSTTGIKMTDQARSFELCEMALNVAIQTLKPGGHFVCKLFHSDDFRTLKARIQAEFKSFEAVKPQSTRSQSKEIFLVGLGKK